MQVDLRRIFLLGTGAWILALVVVGVLALTGMTVTKPFIVCLSGVGVGILLMIWEHSNRWDYRRLAQPPDPEPKEASS